MMNSVRYICCLPARIRWRKTFKDDQTIIKVFKVVLNVVFDANIFPPFQFRYDCLERYLYTFKP